MNHSMHHHTRLLRHALAATLSLAMLAGSPWAQAEDHSAHAHMGGKAGEVKRSEAQYTLPAVNMVRQDGQKVGLRQLLSDQRPVILNFIFTSCTAICPVTSQVFAEARRTLGADASKVNMVSVSIDPENDTPDKLRAYADRFASDTGPGWTFLTGSRDDAIAVQKAFATYQGDKMFHVPVTYVRMKPGNAWIRLDGFAPPALLAQLLKDALVTGYGTPVATRQP